MCLTLFKKTHKKRNIDIFKVGRQVCLGHFSDVALFRNVPDQHLFMHTIYILNNWSAISELEAYSKVVTALRAQGELTKERRKVLNDLGNILNIPVDRHKAEIRRAVNDELLNTIALRYTQTTIIIFNWQLIECYLYLVFVATAEAKPSGLRKAGESFRFLIEPLR